MDAGGVREVANAAVFGGDGEDVAASLNQGAHAAGRQFKAADQFETDLISGRAVTRSLATVTGMCVTLPPARS